MSKLTSQRPLPLLRNQGGVTDGSRRTGGVKLKELWYVEDDGVEDDRDDVVTGGKLLSGGSGLSKFLIFNMLLLEERYTR